MLESDKRDIVQNIDVRTHQLSDIHIYIYPLIILLMRIGLFLYGMILILFDQKIMMI